MYNLKAYIVLFYEYLDLYHEFVSLRINDIRVRMIGEPLDEFGNIEIYCSERIRFFLSKRMKISLHESDKPIIIARSYEIALYGVSRINNMLTDKNRIYVDKHLIEECVSYGWY